MPFPPNLESMIAAGYTFARSEACSVCGEIIEVFQTPGGRELALNPMCEALRPAVRHYQTCNIAPILPRRQAAVEAWRAEAYDLPEKKLQECPPEARFDYGHEWWAFLDQVSAKDHIRMMKEIVP